MKVIELQIYPRCIYLTADMDEFKKHCAGDITGLEESEGMVGEYIDHDKEYNKGAIIYIDKTANKPANMVGTIAHEALHAVNCIFHGIGINYDKINDEHAAYLLGFIAQECYNYISEIKHKGKCK